MHIFNRVKNKAISFIINPNKLKKPYPSSLFNQKIKEWENSPDLRKVNLGCGSRYEKDWLNIDFYSFPPDVFMYNLINPLPFKSDFLDVVYSSNCLEHFSKNDAENFLKECIRVLKPEGILRLAVPDLEMICRSYLNALEHAKNNDIGWKEKYEWAVIELLDQFTRQSSGGEMLSYWCKDVVPAEDFVIERVGTEYLKFRNYFLNNKLQMQSQVSSCKLTPMKVGKFRLSGEPHLWMYDCYSLKCLLEKLGLRQVEIKKFGDSRIIGFSSSCLEIENGMPYKPDSFYIEGIK